MKLYSNQRITLPFPKIGQNYLEFGKIPNFKGKFIEKICQTFLDFGNVQNFKGKVAR